MANEHAAGHRFSDFAQERYEQAQQLVARNPASSVAVGFAAGMGVGLLIGLILGERYQHEEQATAARLGRKVLDAVTAVLPERLASRLPG